MAGRKFFLIVNDIEIQAGKQEPPTLRAREESATHKVKGCATRLGLWANSGTLPCCLFWLPNFLQKTSKNVDRTRDFGM